MPQLYVITTPELRLRDRVSFRFMMDSEAPFKEFQDLSHRWGILYQRPWAKGEFNPFSVVRGGPAQTAPAKFTCHVFESPAGQIMTTSFDFPEDPAEADASAHVEDFVGQLPDCVLLVERRLYDGFVKRLLDAAVAIYGVFHAEMPLASA